jgi:hypothetical protein
MGLRVLASNNILIKDVAVEVIRHKKFFSFGLHDDRNQELLFFFGTWTHFNLFARYVCARVDSSELATQEAIEISDENNHVYIYVTRAKQKHFAELRTKLQGLIVQFKEHDLTYKKRKKCRHH